MVQKEDNFQAPLKANKNKHKEFVITKSETHWSLYYPHLKERHERKNPRELLLILEEKGSIV